MAQVYADVVVGGVLVHEAQLVVDEGRVDVAEGECVQKPAGYPVGVRGVGADEKCPVQVDRSGVRVCQYLDGPDEDLRVLLERRGREDRLAGVRRSRRLALGVVRAVAGHDGAAVRGGIAAPLGQQLEHLRDGWLRPPRRCRRRADVLEEGGVGMQRVVQGADALDGEEENIFLLVEGQQVLRHVLEGIEQLADAGVPLAEEFEEGVALQMPGGRGYDAVYPLLHGAVRAVDAGRHGAYLLGTRVLPGWSLRVVDAELRR